MTIGTLQAGDDLPSFTKGPITRQHLVEWCAAENDYYHLHYDERVAERMKLPGSPIQGTMKMALLGQMIERWTCEKSSLRKITTAYRGLSLEGDTLTCRGQVIRSEVRGGERIVELELWVENSDGTRSTTATATVGLPNA